MEGGAYLITMSHEKDSIGQHVPKETKSEIFVSTGNINRSEWATAGSRGLKADLMLKTASVNYSGEELIEFENDRYGIYRTYTNPETEETELYLEKKAGV